MWHPGNVSSSSYSEGWGDDITVVRTPARVSIYPSSSICVTLVASNEIPNKYIFFLEDTLKTLRWMAMGEDGID